MKVTTHDRHKAFLASIACFMLTGANAQFNIKFGGYSPTVPSTAYGAAASQPGIWNSIGGVRGPIRLVDLRGRQTNSTVFWDDRTFGGRNVADGGADDDDFTRLMSGGQIGTIVQGGFAVIAFDHLPAGVYDVYTYAAQRLSPSNTSVFIQESVDFGELTPLQTITGPAGSSFARTRTHSLHRVVIGTDGRGSFSIQLMRPADMSLGPSLICGVQIVPLPAASESLENEMQNVWLTTRLP